jgi:hypothetical protein
MTKSKHVIQIYSKDRFQNSINFSFFLADIKNDKLTYENFSNLKLKKYAVAESQYLKIKKIN